MLNSDEIRNAMRAKDIDERLIVTPLLDPEKQIGPASVDLRLGTEFLRSRIHEGPTYDPLSPDFVELPIENQVVPLGVNFILHPGQFILGSTLEFVRLPPTLAGQVHSRSSWGRMGLVVTTAAGMQPGYTGMITLELVNHGQAPIALYPGTRVAQLFLWKSSEPAMKADTYDTSKSKYWRPLGPQSSRVGAEREELGRIQRIGEHLGVSIHGDGETGLPKDGG